MYILKRFYGSRFTRMNAIVDSLEGRIGSYIDLIGAATLPLPEVCQAQGLPGLVCGVEGHRDSRLFPATEPMDAAEALTEERVRELFGLEEGYGVTAQPHSATQANQIAFRAVLGDDGGRVAGLAPNDGGHISHRLGIPPSSEFVAFPISEVGIDYEEVAEVVRRSRPAVVVAGGTSFTRGIDFRRMREISDQVGAHLHADLAHVAPFIAAGVHPPAFPLVDSATLDLSKNLRGPTGGILVYRERDRDRMRRSLFPLVQTSPSPSGLLAKAACLSYWTPERLAAHARSMVDVARHLASQLSPLLGDPVFGTTDTHLLLFDVTGVCGDGRVAEGMFDSARILVNRNLVPGDTRSPWAPGGIRLGSTVPAILGYASEDVEALGEALCSVLEGSDRHEEIVTRLLATYHRPLVSSASEPLSPSPT
jgi:glycine hydroxymethyltransferase